MNEFKIVIKLIIAVMAIAVALFASLGLSMSAGYEFRRRNPDSNEEARKFVVDQHLKFYLKAIFFALTPFLILIGVCL